MIIIEANEKKCIDLGRRGESCARKVVFDITDWASLYGQGEAHVVAQRALDLKPYPVNVTQNDTQVSWVITTVDNDQPGYGQCELVYITEGSVAKSVLYQTHTDTSLSDPVSPPDSPSVYGDLSRQIGDLSKLQTKDKTSLVSAINEVASTKPNGGSDEPYTLPVATPEKLGGVKPVSKTGNMTQSVGVDNTGGLWTIPPEKIDLSGYATKKYVDNAIANLPSGGGAIPKAMELIASGTNTEPVRRFKITTDNDGNAFELTKAYFVASNFVLNGPTTSKAVSLEMGGDIIAVGTLQTDGDTKNKEIVAYANSDGVMLATQGRGGIYAQGEKFYFATNFKPNTTITKVDFLCADATQTFKAGATYELWGVRK